MKLFKAKIFALLVIIVFAVILVGGCGQQGAEQEADGGNGASNGEKNGSSSDYPAQTIELIVPYSPGGGTDTNARVVEKYAKKHLGVSVAVKNHPGAGGEVGFVKLWNSDPDGYTIGYTNMPGSVICQVERDPEYKLKEFEPVFGQVNVPKILVVSQNSQWETVEELIEYAENNPGEVVAANNGSGSHAEMCMLTLDVLLEDTSFNHVAYEGTGPMKTALLGGEADILACGPGELDSQLRPLIVFSEERLEDLPNVPTSFEKGLEVELAAQRPIQAPPGTPQDKVDYLAEAFQEMAKDPEYIEAMEDTGAIPARLTPEEVKQSVNNQMEFYKNFRDKLEEVKNR